MNPHEELMLFLPNWSMRMQLMEVTYDALPTENSVTGIIMVQTPRVRGIKQIPTPPITMLENIILQAWF